MRKGPAALRLEVGDRLLVVDVEHLAGENLVPVLHRRVVLAVVGRELRHVVREVLTLAPQLSVASEAAVARVAARVNDLRVRQDQMHEPDVREVIRQLVREEWPARRAEITGLLDVLLAVRAEVLRPQLEDGFRIADMVTPIAADGGGDTAQRREHARAFALAVTGEELLDQRRPGAWQPDA